MIRILLAEDQHLIRGALLALIRLNDDMRVVAELSHGDQILPACMRERPDVAVLDIDLPGTDGLTAAAALRDQLPETKVLILTGLGNPGQLVRALEAEVAGFLRKDAPPQELADAIRRVAKTSASSTPSSSPPPTDRHQPAHPPRNRRPARRCRRRHDRGDRRANSSSPARQYATTSPTPSQTRRPQPHRRNPHRPRRRLDLRTSAHSRGHRREARRPRSANERYKHRVAPPRPWMAASAEACETRAKWPN